MNREEIAWAGGFYEGEGCIFSRYVRRMKDPYTSLIINNTDLEPLERFQAAVGLGHIRGPYQPKQGQRQPQYHYEVNGFEKSQAIIAMLWPFLSARRKAQAVGKLYHGKR